MKYTEIEKLDDIKALKSMIESCYTYGGIEKTSWNFERYLKPYIPKLGKRLFNRIYNIEASRLSNYKVISNVYEDAEGVTYNQLVVS